MGIDNEINEGLPPVFVDKTNVELIDYFCPFCNFKLFRGNVIEFNMVCSQCNKLVRSAMISTKEEESKS